MQKILKNDVVFQDTVFGQILKQNDVQWQLINVNLCSINLLKTAQKTYTTVQKFRVSNTFFSFFGKNLYFFFRKDALNWSGRKEYIYNVTKDFKAAQLFFLNSNN